MSGSGDPPCHNLPTYITNFIGRAGEMHCLRRLIVGGCLVTIAGTAGSGKTRLASEVARRIASQFSHGAWLADLSGATNPDDAAHTVADALGVTNESGGHLHNALASRLRARQMLLVLDNCEHVTAGAGSLTRQLLHACPGATILTTSREPLGIDGEVVFWLRGLSLPPLKVSLRATDATRYEAIQLFLERGRAADTRFGISADNAAAIAHICAHLDGLPLAIELAAARLRGMSAAMILERLQRPMRLLNDGPRDWPPRHRSMAAAIESSYSTLDSADQSVLRRLCVFDGRFRLEDARSLFDAETAGEADSIHDAICRLVDKSMVSVEERSAETEYRVLEIVKDFGRLQLTPDEEDCVMRRHAEYFLELADTPDITLSTLTDSNTVRVVSDYYGNFAVALRWSSQHEPTLAVRLTLALTWFWWLSSRVSEGRAWLEQVLQWQSVDARSRMWLSHGLAAFAHLLGEFELAEARALEALNLARRAGRRDDLAQMLLLAGNETRVRAPESAQAHYFEALELFRELDDRLYVAGTLANLAALALAGGDLESAFRYCDDGLRHAHHVGSDLVACLCLTQRGCAAIASRNIGLAESSFKQVMQLVGRIEPLMALCIEGLACVMALRGDPSNCLRMASAVASYREQTHIKAEPAWSRLVEESVNESRQTLGDRNGAEAWREGYQLHLLDALRLADSPARLPRRFGRILTGREEEVAVLIADGLTNRQIGDRLRIKERTVDAHVEHMKDKLNMRSRVQIAAWALQNTGGRDASEPVNPN